MMRILTGYAALLALALITGFLAACSGGDGRAADARVGDGEQEEEAAGSEEEQRGPNGGRLITGGDFQVETKVDESGGEPRFRLWAYEKGKLVTGSKVRAEVRTIRLGGATQRFSLVADGDSLTSTDAVPEPHSFDVEVSVVVEDRTVNGSYASYETRTQLDPQVAAAAGVKAATAGPGTIRQTLPVYGSIIADAQNVREIRARFPGIAVSVTANLGDRVRRGAPLATIESNESLQRYVVSTPIDGQIISRQANAGEAVGEEVIFTVADLSRVSAEFAVFRRDLGRVRMGQPVTVMTEDGALTAGGSISYLTPIGTATSQSLAARVPIDNADGRWAPGLFVKGSIVIGERQVPLAVRISALQRIRDLPVVFERVGNIYEPRFIKLGASDGELTEVLDGLASGATYVVEQSYLIKADIEKSGAEHSH